MKLGVLAALLALVVVGLAWVCRGGTETAVPAPTTSIERTSRAESGAPPELSAALPPHADSRGTEAIPAATEPARSVADPSAVPPSLTDFARSPFEAKYAACGEKQRRDAILDLEKAVLAIEGRDDAASREACELEIAWLRAHPTP